MVRGNTSPMSGAHDASAATLSRSGHGPTSTRAGSRRRGRLGLAACLAAVGLLASACGSNHGSSDGSRTTGANTTTTAGGDTGGATKFGTLASPCGKGDAKGSTAKGVTDSDITIGYGDDAGYAAAPGLDKEMTDAMKAMIGWCNDQGGINGRQVKGNYYDGKVTDVGKAIAQACTDNVFMLVGQGWVFDSGQEQARIKCELPSIPGYAVSTAFSHGPGVIQPIPSPGDETPASFAFELADKFPDAVKKAAFVYADYPATKETRDKYAAAFPKAGWKFQDCDQKYNIQGESDWKPIADNLKACGSEVVVWVGSPNPNFENFLAAAKQEGFEPKAWLSDANSYDSSFAKWNADNDGAADNVYIRLATVPFEDADTVPAVKLYSDLIDKEKGTKALLGVQATSAFLLWATGVQACGSDVTRKCVFDEVKKQTAWTAGGLHAPTNPGANVPPSCGVLIQMDGGDFKQVVPTKTGFDCNDKYLVKGLKTDALTQAKLDGDRVATEYGTFTVK